MLADATRPRNNDAVSRLKRPRALASPALALLLASGCALPRGAPRHATHAPPPAWQPAPPYPPPWPGPAPAAAPPPAAPSTAVAFAQAQVGKPYCRGGEGPRCFDCSGLVQAAWAWAGVQVPRTSDEQARSLDEVPTAALRPGDVVWWPGHVGLYVGGGEIVDARGVRAGVVRRALRHAPARVLRPRPGGAFAAR